MIVSHVLKDGNVIWTYFDGGKSARSIADKNGNYEHTYFDEQEKEISKERFFSKDGRETDHG